jgi:hypothetical protein
MHVSVMTGASSSWPTRNELDALVNQLAGLLIFASTVVKFIKDPCSIPQEQLDVVLKGENNHVSWMTDLDQLYSNVLLASSHYPELKLTIGTIILFGTSFTPGSLVQLLRIDLCHLLAVLEGLHPIFSIPKDPNADPVTLFHSSLHDFLTSKSHAGDYFIARLCLGCIATLPEFSFPTFCDPIQHQNSMKKHLEKQDETYRIATHYACHHYESEVQGIILLT